MVHFSPKSQSNGLYQNGGKPNEIQITLIVQLWPAKTYVMPAH